MSFVCPLSLCRDCRPEVSLGRLAGTRGASRLARGRRAWVRGAGRGANWDVGRAWVWWCWGLSAVGHGDLLPPALAHRGARRAALLGKERMVVSWGAVEEIVGSKGVMWVGKMHA